MKIDNNVPQPAPRPSPRKSLPLQGTIPIGEDVEQQQEQQRPAEPERADYQACRLCVRHHALRVCKVFRALMPAQGYLIARAHKYCTNCLALSHHVSSCTSSGTCKTCGQPHHTLLHRTELHVAKVGVKKPAQRLLRQVPTRKQQFSVIKQRSHPARAQISYCNHSYMPLDRRAIRRPAQGLRPATFRGQVTKLLVNEALRTLEECKKVLPLSAPRGGKMFKRKSSLNPRIKIFNLS